MIYPLVLSFHLNFMLPITFVSKKKLSSIATVSWIHLSLFAAICLHDALVLVFIMDPAQLQKFMDLILVCCLQENRFGKLLFLWT